jgi:putative polyhydroxyalkanoate system protein
MPDIDINQPHRLGKQACRDAAEAAARDLGARLGLNGMVWEGDTLGFAGRGLEGRLTVGDHEARVQVRLGPLLGLMRPVIEAEIRRQLCTRLG